MNKRPSYSENRQFPWLTCLFLLLIFILVTPFDFNWPATVKLRQNIIGTQEAIARMKHGNLERQIGMLMLGIFALFSLAKSKNRYRINGTLGWLLVFYLIWVMFSLAWTIDMTFTLHRVITVAILWFGAIAVAGRYSFKQLAAIALFVCGTTLALAFFNELRLHTIDISNPLWRFSGVFHTVAMGWNCGLLGLAALYLVTDEKRKMYKYFLWFVLVVSLVFLLLTKSRMAVAAALLSMGLYLFRVVSARDKLAFVLTGTIVVCLGYLVFGDLLLHYGVEASTLGRGRAAKESVTSLTGRIPLWLECFKWLEERPLQGYGFNSFVSPENITLIARHIGWIPNSIHSGYIDALMGLGFIGAGSLITFLVLSLKKAYDLSQHIPAYIFVCSVLVWLYYNLFLEANLITRPMFMTFFCMIILARLAFLPEKEWEPDG